MTSIAGRWLRERPESTDDVRAAHPVLFLPALVGLLVVGVYPFREAGSLLSRGLVEHVFGLSGLATLMAAVFFVFHIQRYALSRVQSLVLVLGAGIAALACILYLPLETAFIALAMTESAVLALLLLQRAGALMVARMHLTSLRWLTILMPPVFILGVTLTTYAFHLTNAITHRTEHLALTVTLFAGTFPFALFVFRVFENIQNEILSQRDELSRLHSDAIRRSQQLRAINNAGLDLTSVLSLEVRARRLVDLGRELTGATDGSLLLLEGEEPRWLLVNGESCANLSGQLMGWADAKEKLCECHLCETLIPWPESRTAGKESLTIPLQWQGGTLGILTLVRADGGAFTEKDQEIIGMYAQWGTLAMKNAQLHQQVKALAVMEERDRIAREMHDNFGQMLGYMNTKAQAIGLLLAAERDEDARAQLGELEETARELYEDVREEISGLRATKWLDQGLLAALKTYATQFEETSGIETVIEIKADRSVPLSLEAQLQVFRVVQEALANVRKHADAPRALVRVRATPDALVINVIDEGTGFTMPPLEGDRFGLRTMKERAEALSGHLRISSALGRGTKVTLEVPLAAASKVSTS